MFVGPIALMAARTDRVVPQDYASMELRGHRTSELGAIGWLQFRGRPIVAYPANNRTAPQVCNAGIGRRAELGWRLPYLTGPICYCRSHYCCSSNPFCPLVRVVPSFLRIIGLAICLRAKLPASVQPLFIQEPRRVRVAAGFEASGHCRRLPALSVGFSRVSERFSDARVGFEDFDFGKLTTTLEFRVQH